MTPPLRVHFDQNCMNARGIDPELQRVQRLHDDGNIVLVANLRNRLELGRPENYGEGRRLMRARLDQFEETPEEFRLDVSPLDEAVLGAGSVDELNPTRVWSIVFPGSPFPTGGHPFESGQNSLHDVMHIVNAHDSRVDVFLTREKKLLAAGPRLRSELGVRPSIESPTDLLRRFGIVVPNPP